MPKKIGEKKKIIKIWTVTSFDKRLVVPVTRLFSTREKAQACMDDIMRGHVNNGIWALPEAVTYFLEDEIMGMVLREGSLHEDRDDVETHIKNQSSKELVKLFDALECDRYHKNTMKKLVLE